MKKLNNLKIKILCIVIIFFFNACTQKEKQKGYNEFASELDCLSDPSWFPHSQTPAPNEGIESPFYNGKTVTNLDFYRWSWQKFLWLTKPTIITRTINFIEDATSNPLKINDTLPLFLVKDQIYPINDAMEILKTRGAASVHLIYDQQACSNEVLKTNPAYGDVEKSFDVLYSLHTSPIMMKAAKQYIEELKSGVLDSIKNYATFPVGSLELKVSWVEIEALPNEDLEKYFVTTGAVSRDNGKSYKLKEVAMLGMHVVGVVENHPEFIWATFEHKGLTTSYNWSIDKAISAKEKLLFKKGSTTGIHGIVFPKDSSIHSIPYKAYELFRYGVPVNTDGSYMITSQSEPKNINNIKDINTCVSNHLKDEFKNYFCNGAVWLNTEDYISTEAQAELIVGIGSKISSALPKSVNDLGLLRGSTNCANTTMETFTQSFESSLDSVNVNTVANCFSCHGAASFKNYDNQSPLYLSHVFDAAVQKSRGSTNIQIEAMKNKEVLLHFINN